MSVTCTCENAVLGNRKPHSLRHSLKESGWQGGPEHAGAFFSVESGCLGHRNIAPAGTSTKEQTCVASEKTPAPTKWAISALDGKIRGRCLTGGIKAHVFVSMGRPTR